MPYDEETRRLIENRKRNAEYRKEQQMKKRKMTLAALGAIIALLVIVIIIAASCSSRKDTEIQTEPSKETTIVGMTTPEVTTVESTESQSVAESTAENQSTTVENESTTSEDGDSFKHTNDTVNVRKEPNEDATILEVLEENEKVEVLGTEGKWTHVKWGEIEGYISSEYLD